VLSELAETSVSETPPVELMARVQAWQERLDGADLPDAADAPASGSDAGSMSGSGSGSGPTSGSRAPPGDG